MPNGSGDEPSKKKGEIQPMLVHFGFNNTDDKDAIDKDNLNSNVPT